MYEPAQATKKNNVGYIGGVNAHVLPVDGGLLAHTPTYAQTLAMGSAGPNTIVEP